MEDAHEENKHANDGVRDRSLLIRSAEGESGQMWRRKGRQVR